MKGKGVQSRLPVCDPMDCIVHGNLQARILEWVAFPFSRNLPNPGMEPWSPHCRQILYRLSQVTSKAPPSPGSPL